MDKNVTQAMKPMIGKRQGRSRLSSDALVGAITSGDETEFGMFKRHLGHGIPAT
jgi:hypothetical protein